MSDPNRPALQRAWPIICDLIALLQIYVPRLTPDAAQRWRFLQLTRVAESLVRRWLVLKACVEGWSEVRVGTRSRSKADVRSRVTRSAPRAAPPRFRLAEAEPRMPVWVYYPETETAPGGWWLEYARTGTAPSALSGAHSFNPANLQRRCAALSDVMAEPDKHVRRMARWLARAADRRKTEPGRQDPLAIGPPPGASRAQKKRDPERQNMLYWLHYLAREAVMRGGP
ncbi:MAG: hypothetical protein AAF437_14195 [Pseudomonadota bacterium]